MNVATKVLSLLGLEPKFTKHLWFSLSLGLSIFYGILAMHQAFSSEYVVQDDARQHIFWMQRYLNSGLFPGDVIADYFESIAPLGYSSVYRLFAYVGVEPLVLSKFIPPIMGAIAAGFAFWVTLEIFPVPFAGFVTSVTLSQTMWASDELSSGTPRAFLYPLLLAFLYYLLRKSWFACVVLVALQVLVYPQSALISLSLVAIRLIHWQDKRLSLSQDWRDYTLLALGSCCILALALYMQAASEFGPVVTRTAAEAMPEFQAQGRNSFFDSGLGYWLDGYPDRSGIFHRKTFFPRTLFVGLSLPFLLLLPFKTHTVRKVRSQGYILLQLLLVSLVWYVLAHLLLFKLHLPSRYTSHTIRIVLVLAAGISWTMLLQIFLRASKVWMGASIFKQDSKPMTSLASLLSQLLTLGIPTCLLVGMVFYYPLFVKDFPITHYYDLSYAEPTYEFFASQPKDSLIASLSYEASNIPTFSARSVFISSEHALAYHTGYYSQFRQRAEALIQAHYSEDPAVLSDFVDRYEINFWLLDDKAFQATYLTESRWLKQFQPMADDAILTLQEGRVPVLQQSIPGCMVLQTDSGVVLDALCVRKFAKAAD